MTAPAVGTRPLLAPDGPKSTVKLQGDPYVVAPTITGTTPADATDGAHNEQVLDRVSQCSSSGETSGLVFGTP